MLLDLVRKVVPINVRQDVGLWAVGKVASSKFLAYPFFYLLCGEIPKGLKTLPGGKCSITYNGYEITSPRDGLFTFIEVLQDEVYEKLGSPKERDVVLDIGAYVGMFTLKVANLVGKSGMVIPIEPSPTNLSYLKQNVNHLGNVKIVEEAILDRIGEGKLYLSSASPCHSLVYPHKDFLKVKVNTLDNLAKQLNLPHVDFIKIDIEGAELQALEGARGILTKNNIRCAIASYHTLPNGTPELPQIINFFQSVGYHYKIIDKYVYAERKGSQEKYG